MDRTLIEETIRRILENSGSELARTSIEEDSLSACGLSSLAWLRLMIELENTFGIELDLQQAGSEEILSVQTLVRYVESELDKR